MQYIYLVLILTTQTYTKSLLNDGSAHDGSSYSLYRVLNLTAHTYTELLLNDENAPHGRSYNLYPVLTLTTQTYTQSLLNEEVFLMVTFTDYIRLHPDSSTYTEALLRD